MATIGVLLLGALLGLVLAIFGSWIVALFLSVASFLTWFGTCLYRGDTPTLAFVQSFALASVVQISYVVTGYFLLVVRPCLNKTKRVPSEDGMR